MKLSKPWIRRSLALLLVLLLLPVSTAIAAPSVPVPSRAGIPVATASEPSSGSAFSLIREQLAFVQDTVNALLEPDVQPQAASLSDITYPVTFFWNFDDGSYDGVFFATSAADGAPAMPPASDPVRAGYRFLGWSPEQEIPVSDSTTNAYGVSRTLSDYLFDFDTPITGTQNLFALWEELPVWTVTFHLNHPETYGSGIYDQTKVVDGDRLVEPADPTRHGWVFMGWFEAREDIVPLDVDVTYLEDDYYEDRVLPYDYAYDYGYHYYEPITLMRASDLPNQFDLYTPIHSDLALYARWRLETAIPLASTHYAYLIGDDDSPYIRPLDPITRAEVATVLLRLLDSTYRKDNWTKENSFPDVHVDSWYNNAISTMYAIGLFENLPGDLFYPNAAMTRAEFSVLAAQFFALDYLQIDDVFLDIYDNFARDSINLLGAAEILQVSPDGLFRPYDLITRAEVTAIINRILNRRPQSVTDVSLPHARRWVDNLYQDAWFYLDIQEATNSHTHKVKDGGLYETWVSLLPRPGWAALERPSAIADDWV